MRACGQFFSCPYDCISRKPRRIDPLRDPIPMVCFFGALRTLFKIAPQSVAFRLIKHIFRFDRDLSAQKRDLAGVSL